MNADGRALFDSICADPEDDVSRLAYADWLDEQGDEPRAEALRMSVERRRLPVWEPRSWVLDSRLGRLHKKHRKAWNAAVPKQRGVVAEVGASGLVEEIRVLSIRAFLHHEGNLFGTGPISSLDLAMDRGSAGELLACPSLARVRELRFSMARIERMDLPRLAESPTLENLRVLDLDESGPDLADYLTTCPPFPRLESLKFVRQSFGGEWPRAVPLLRTVRKLVLLSCYLQSGWLGHLLRLPSIQGLRHLDLYECWATGFGDFFGVDWQGLECLLVNANSFGVTAARCLARCPRMTSLRWLDLGAEYDRLGDKGLKALAGSDYLGGLRVLDLSINQITAAGLDAMSRAPWARTLARLDLSANSLRKEGAAALASPAYEGLRWLELYNCDIGLRELSPLLDTAWAPGLTHLDLGRNKFGAKAARLLASTLSPDTLELLQLADNPIPDRERKLLRERFGDRVRFADSWDE